MSVLPGWNAAGPPSIMGGVLRRVSSATFVGRADELAALDGALDRAVAGMPAFAFVAGESGVGKSRLVVEFEARATTAGARVLIGHCLELGGTVFPYAPLVDALRPVARELAECGTDLELPAGTRAALAELHPEFGAGRSTGRRAHRDQARLFEALLTLLERLGRDRPVALVLEDLHWADPSTRDFLVFLVRSARTEALCLLVTYRSDELHRRHPLRPVLAELERVPGVQRIAVERFSRAEVAAQLAGILDAPADDDLTERLYARGQGNPLYTEELLAASADGCGELPETLRDALLGRFERLPAAAQEVVRVAAVVERPMSHALLVAMSTLPEAELLEGAREAVAHQVLVSHPDGTYAFRHALVGEAIFEDLLPGERTALHAALADRARDRPGAARRPSARRPSPPSWRATGAPRTTCRGRSARPWRPASPPGACSPTARRCATSSARSSCGSACPTPPSAPACRAPTCCGRPPRRPATRSSPAAPSRSSARRSPTARPAPTRCASRSCTPSWRATCGTRASTTRATTSCGWRSTCCLPKPSSSARSSARQKAKDLMLRGHFREAAAEAAAAAKDARRLGAVVLETAGCNTEGFSRAALGDTEEGARLLREARDLAAREGAPGGHVRAVINLSEMLDLSGRTEEALAEVRAALPLVRTPAEPSAYGAFLELQQANQLLRLGRTGEAAAALPAPHSGRRGRHDRDVPERRARAARDRARRRRRRPPRARHAPAPGHRQPRPAVERAARADVGAARGARGPARGRARRRRPRPGGRRRHRRGRAAPEAAVGGADGRGRRRRARRRPRRAVRRRRRRSRCRRGWPARATCPASGPRGRTTRRWRPRS